MNGIQVSIFLLVNNFSVAVGDSVYIVSLAGLELEENTGELKAPDLAAGGKNYHLSHEGNPVLLFNESSWWFNRDPYIIYIYNGL